MDVDDLAIVTGSTNNIGRAIAEGLSQDGYHVIVTSRHGDEARAVAERLPTEASAYEVDFADRDEIDGLFEFVEANSGDLSVLVNNVARTSNETILDCDPETWDRTIETNLGSYYYCTRHAAQSMSEADGGAIVNVGLARTGGSDSKFSYSVAKGGVAMLTRCAARDLAPHGIRVNAVGSGLIGTPVGHDDYAGREYENERVPLGHIGEPKDIANAVRFLVSEEANYVVGGTIPVDGGKEA